jgi:hypothetical protein
MLEKFYPSTEKFLLDAVKENDLHEYIFHGFALVTIDGVEKYVSYSWEKPMIAITKTPEIEEVFRKKEKNCNNNSGYIRLLAKLKHIQVHYLDNAKSWEMIKTELEKEENKVVYENYQTAIDYLIGCMFPRYIGNN